MNVLVYMEVGNDMHDPFEINHTMTIKRYVGGKGYGCGVKLRGDESADEIQGCWEQLCQSVSDESLKKRHE